VNLRERLRKKWSRKELRRAPRPLVASRRRLEEEYGDEIPIPVLQTLGSVHFWRRKRGFFAFIQAPVPPDTTYYSSTVAICDGWNGSFHAADFDWGGILAWGPTPAKAVARARKAWCALQEEAEDPCTTRFRLRSLVRSGD